MKMLALDSSLDSKCSFRPAPPIKCEASVLVATNKGAARGCSRYLFSSNRDCVNHGNYHRLSSDVGLDSTEPKHADVEQLLIDVMPSLYTIRCSKLGPLPHLNSLVIAS